MHAKCHAYGILLLQLFEFPDAVLPPSQPLKSEMFPVIYHQSVFFLSTSEARVQFMSNPEKFISQPPPESAVPVRLAVLGPPKSGKSSGMQYFVHVRVAYLNCEHVL